MKKFPKIPIRAGCIALAVTILTAACGICGSYIPKNQAAAFAVNKDYNSDNVHAAATLSYNSTSIPRIRTLSRSHENSLYVGGMPFGVKFSTEGVLVVGYGSEQPKNANPGFLAGIRPSDSILKINEKSVNDVSAMTDAVDSSKGEKITLLCRRKGKEFTAELTPYRSSGDGKYKTGLLVRDSGAGIGTVTYYMPNSGRFAGLGHPVCDVDTGEIIPLSSGEVVGVNIQSVTKGSAGAAGELRGCFTPGKAMGSLYLNNRCGVFGTLETQREPAEAVPLGLKQDVHTGEAVIRTTISGREPKEYAIEIEKADWGSTGTKNMVIHITDPALLDATGGIVQGMSGSPILQDGRLIGAVTHVFVSDPTRGYGIFLENMLSMAG